MTSTALKRRDLDKTRGGFVNAPGDPAFNRGTAFNQEDTLMYTEGQNGVCLLNLFESLADLGTSSDLPGYEFTVYHVLFINL